MKPHNFFRLTLFIPFVLWFACLLLVIPISASNIDLSEAWKIILAPVMFYTIGILLWFLPYTILALGLWVWSTNRSAPDLRKAALVSPILLTFLMLLEGGILYTLANDLAKFVESADDLVITFGLFSTMFGYLCVGIGFGIFKLAQSRNLIVDPSPPSLQS